MPLKSTTKTGARAADYFLHFEEDIELVIRCQDNGPAIIEVADYLQACGVVVLVVRTAGDRKKPR